MISRSADPPVRIRLATLLMHHVLDYTRQHRIERVLLHASLEGRPLYESLGFVPTNEMKLAVSPRA